MVARRIGSLLGAVFVALAVLLATPTLARADDQWTDVAGSITTLLDKIPGQYDASDVAGVESTIREIYYEQYQVSGLEDDVKHRLGAERATTFQTELLQLRTLVRERAPRAQVVASVDELKTRIITDVAEVNAAPELNDRWAKVAASITETSNNALRLYQEGNNDEAFSEASRAYLEHYEAGGLEKATLAYMPGNRVAQVEAEFREIRMGIKDGAPVDTVAEHVDTLNQMVTADAAELDALDASESVGWPGFIASFLILLREGAEALLVVAAVITYVVKAGRRDQLAGVYAGIGAAIAVSIGLAVLFNTIASSAAIGMTQELIEGIAGALAAVMLIYISNWILSKAEGDSWHDYITDKVDKKATFGGTFALFFVVFLAVAREGFETILFYIPVFGSAKTTGDQLMVWAGIAAAVIVLAILFVIVRVFGIKLPLRSFFRWTSVILALLAITITGGAVKEFQDAMLISATPVAGVPQIDWLGLYPTLEGLLAQAAVTALLIVLAILQIRKTRELQAPAVEDNNKERVETQ